MEQRIIIITGKQGSGKTTYAKKLEKDLIQKGYENVHIFEYETSGLKSNLMHLRTTSENTNVIVCVQKELLHEIVPNNTRRPFVILDLDFLKL